MNHDIRAGRKVASNNPDLDEIKLALAQSIQQMPQKAKLVLALYYLEKLSLKEIGKILDTSESKVSKIQSKAITILRERFRKAKTACQSPF